MSRQDKATTDRNARILRELVKQPDNKACADCRKNDARWASWNLGVYLCIRCSGIHRSMGTHISRVKSIDLDIWTPEQMENIQRWGNKRANLYWERHLKSGHVPPEHKIESFIRSKYESRRWAMEGPLPADPATLENGAAAHSPPQPDHASRPAPTSTAPPPQPAGRAAHPLLSRQTAQKPAAASTAALAPPIIDIFADDPPPPAAQPTAAPSAGAPPAAPTPTTAAAAPGPTAAAQTQSNHLFDLDFRPPSVSAGGAGSARQSNKNDIMSLFSSPSPSVASPTGAGGFGGQVNSGGQGFFGSAATPQQSQGQIQQPGGYSAWGGGITSAAAPAQQHATQSPVGGAAGWGGMGIDQNAWGAPVQVQQPTAQPQQPQRQPSFGGGGAWGSTGGGAGGGLAGLGGLGGDPWASNGTGAGGGAANGFGIGAGSGFGQSNPAPQVKKDDPFANIWE